MKIDVSELRKVKGRIEKFLGNEPDYSSEIYGQQTTFRNMTVAGEATNSGEGIYIHGKITGDVDLICSLCVKNYSVHFDTPFVETFYREGMDYPEDEEEPLQFYHGEEIDISETIRESLQLVLPMKPVCSPDCKGLCAHCGCDLNIEQCSCKEEGIDPRLAVLGQLIKDPDKNSK
ncbi:MAG TPA: hypothetical protein DDY25_07035 [Peptococcaceae bacterium]|nr:hypothetical protein [Peptococcaceae bacterium]